MATSQWRYKVPFCSIRSMQHIKLVFGAPVNCQIRKGLLQRVGVGVGTTKFDHGLPLDNYTNCKEGMCRTYKVWMQE